MTGLSVMKWDFRNQLQATATQRTRSIPETKWNTYADGGQRTIKLTQNCADAGCEPTRKQERFHFGDFEIYRKYKGDGQIIQLESHTLSISDSSDRTSLIEVVTKGKEKGPPMLTRYQLGNHLGSAVLELSENAEIVTYEEYYPYGRSSYRASSLKQKHRGSDIGIQEKSTTRKAVSNITDLATTRHD